LPSKRKSSKEGDSEDEEEEETEEHRSDRSKVLKSWLFYNGLLHLAYWTNVSPLGSGPTTKTLPRSQKAVSLHSFHSAHDKR